VSASDASDSSATFEVVAAIDITAAPGAPGAISAITAIHTLVAPRRSSDARAPSRAERKSIPSRLVVRAEAARRADLASPARDSGRARFRCTREPLDRVCNRASRERPAVCISFR